MLESDKRISYRSIDEPSTLPRCQHQYRQCGHWPTGFGTRLLHHELYQQMADNLQVMREVIEFGCRDNGSIGPQRRGRRLREAVEQGKTVGGTF